MCQQCVEAFDELWPELNAEERAEFLWSCTAFPAGNNTRERLEHFLGAVGKDLGAAIALADQETQRAMAILNDYEAERAAEAAAREEE